VLPDTLTVHVGDVPEDKQEPPQPEKVEFVSGVAVRVILPDVWTEQVSPQLIPPPLTVPEPVPLFVMDRVFV
jgi:hypothetical protein